MIFNFYINDIEVEEPVGFDGTTIKLKRSDKWHGVMVESMIISCNSTVMDIEC